MADSAQRRGRIWRTSLTLVLLLASALVPAQARIFKVLHTFHSGKGPQFPSGRLVLDADGNLYGIAGGGKGTCFVKNNLCGTVFKMNKSGKLVWVYSFSGPDGDEPYGGLLRDASGNLFGVTIAGGVNTKACLVDSFRVCGVVFKLDPTGKKETVLHKFTNNPDGEEPESLLIEDSIGNLYGTTLGGGSDFGTVFKVSPEGKETVLYTFPWPNYAYGAFPYVGVIGDSAGNLYGTTADGGEFDYGTVYELDSTSKETVLYSFEGESDGKFPSLGASLIRDPEGNLYGTTQLGGNEQVNDCDGDEGCGVVFKVSPNSDGTWTDTTLYEFCSQSNCTDGWYPAGGLVRDAAGNLYGTTYRGGFSQSDCCGVVFKLDTTGKSTVLHTFTGGADGSYPQAGLVRDAAGNIYGSASSGGDLNCQPSYGGCGVVFRITP